jgi:hypothetical protein
MLRHCSLFLGRRATKGGVSSLRGVYVITIQGVSAKIFEPNNSVVFQRIFVKFKMQIF